MEEKQISIRHLRIFIEVYNSMNVTKAAEKLGLPQPSVSRTLKEIEDHYNVVLFERMMRRITPTAEGKRFYHMAQRVVDSYDRMEEKLSEKTQGELIRVGASIRLGNELLPKLIKKFKAEYGEVETYVKISNQAVLEYKLLHNELDFAFCENVMDQGNFICEKFGEDELVVVVSPEHKLAKHKRIALETLLDYPLLVREEGASSRELLKHVLRSHDLVAQPAWESISTEAILKAVKAGLGISVLPLSLVKKYVDKGTLCCVEVEGRPFIHNLYIVHHKDKFLTENMKNLIEMSKSI